LAPADFSGAVFTCGHFQKKLKHPAYAIFTTFLDSNDFNHADLVHADLFPDPKYAQAKDWVCNG
jgi:hypothetical protein